MSRTVLWVPGHVLVDNGRAFHWHANARVWTPGPMSGEGHAKCTCGVISPSLPSQGKRIKWMREVHKPEVIEAKEKNG